MPTKTKTKRNHCPTPSGVLLIIGGAENKLLPAPDDQERKTVEKELEVLEAFYKLTNSRNPKIEIITTATSDPSETVFSKYQQALKKFGSCQVNHIHHDTREEVINQDILNRINEAHGLFFAGGDQLKITSIYGGTQFMLLIKERYIFEGLLVAGTSAGAMALSTPMIYAGVGRDEMIAGNVKVTTGLEFLRDVCIDTHFVDRGRFVRMAQVIATNPAAIGIGIEENTALIVKNGVDAEVIGTGLVITIDAKSSFGSNVTNFNDEELITIRGLNVDILSKGETFTIPQMNPPHK